MGSDLVSVGRVGKPHGLDGGFFVDDASEREGVFAEGATLYAGGRVDPKAIVESEAIFAEIVQYVTEANRSAAAE